MIRFCVLFCENLSIYSGTVCLTSEPYLITRYYGSKQVQQAAFQTLFQVLAFLEALCKRKNTNTSAFMGSVGIMLSMQM